MNSVQKARATLKLYPQALTKCSAQAAKYGKCIAANEGMKKDNCAKEFQELKECFQAAMKSLVKP